MTSSLENFMNRVINVVTGDGRNIVGMLKVCFYTSDSTTLEIYDSRLFSLLGEREIAVFSTSNCVVA